MAAIATFPIDCSLSILLIAVVSFSFFFVCRIRYPRAPVHQITSALRTVACAGDFVLALDSLVLYWGREEVMLDMLVYCRRGNALLKRIYARVSTTFLLPFRLLSVFASALWFEGTSLWSVDEILWLGPLSFPA